MPFVAGQHGDTRAAPACAGVALLVLQRCPVCRGGESPRQSEPVLKDQVLWVQGTGLGEERAIGPKVVAVVASKVRHRIARVTAVAGPPGRAARDSGARVPSPRAAQIPGHVWGTRAALLWRIVAARDGDRRHVTIRIIAAIQCRRGIARGRDCFPAPPPIFKNRTHYCVVVNFAGAFGKAWGTSDSRAVARAGPE